MELDAPRPYEPDDATVTLILQLHSEDLEELFNADKGKGRDDDVSDARLAAAAYQQELQMMGTLLADRSMSRSLTRAVISDATLLNESLAEENDTARDRAFAHTLAGDIPPAATTEKGPPLNDLDDGFIARLAVRYVSEGNNMGGPFNDTVDNDDSTVAESSARAASRQGNSPTASRQCIACDATKPLFDVCRTPCGHFYCQECIQNLFKSSTTDETMFPPRCCRKVIPLASVKIYLSASTVQEFEKKSMEFQASDSIFCSQQDCSSIIPRAKITGDQAICENCGTQTCTTCKTKAHDGDCPQDVATQQTLETARKHGWQRCYNCRRLVELVYGCNSIV